MSTVATTHALRTAARACRLHGLPVVLSMALGAAVLTASCRCSCAAPEAGPARTAPDIRRELLVPWDELDVILQSGPRRVLTPWTAYAELVRQAAEREKSAPPAPWVFGPASYRIALEPQRAVIEGEMDVELLEAGAHVVPVGFSGVWLSELSADGAPAPMIRLPDGRMALVLEGAGVRRLRVTALAPVETGAARQSLTAKLHGAGTGRLRLTAPGDVEIRGGAALVSRRYDAAVDRTEFELLPAGDALSFSMSLNSRLRRSERLLTARSVTVVRLMEASEACRATFSFEALNRGVESLEFDLPAGFEVTEVQSDHLARWEIEDRAGRPVLTAFLRGEPLGRILINVTAERAQPPWSDWAFPAIVPRGVSAHTAVLGLELDERLEAERVETEQLLPVDTEALRSSAPATPDTVRVFAAYYAPGGGYGLRARFIRAPAEFVATINSVLTVGDGGLRLRAGVSVLPRVDRMFHLDVALPAEWSVSGVQAADGQPLAHDLLPGSNAMQRVRVRLPAGCDPGRDTALAITAVHTPPGWLNPWEKADLVFPTVMALGSEKEQGALAIVAEDDMTVEPVAADALTPLDEREKIRYGLGGVRTDLAYAYAAHPCKLQAAVGRQAPHVTAETYSFFRVERDALLVRYEAVYDVARAAVRTVVFSLPTNTPANLVVTGCAGTQVKGAASEERGAQRVWRVSLAAPSKGSVHVATDVVLPLEKDARGMVLLPLVRAGDVRYQSGMVAVEGHAELDVRVTNHPRPVDIGELVDADYETGSRLLGAYSTVGDPVPVELQVIERAASALPAVLIERAEAVTALSSRGQSQTSVRYRLRGKAQFVEVELPPGSTLWSLLVDGEVSKPQQAGGRVLVGLPSTGGERIHEIDVVYETPCATLGFWTQVPLALASIAFRGEDHAAAGVVPMADLQWSVHPPSGYRLAGADGTLHSPSLAPRAPAPVALARRLVRLGGGVGFRRGLVGGCVAMSGCGIASARHRASFKMGEVVDTLSESRLEDNSIVAADLGVQATEPAPPQDFAPQPAASPDPQQQPPASGPVAKKPVSDGLAGLRIRLGPVGRGTTFYSLGEEPALRLSLANERRVGALSWALALLSFLGGVLALHSPSHARRRAAIPAVILVSIAVPLLPGCAPSAAFLDRVFLAGLWLIPWAVIARPALRAATGLHARRLARAAQAASALAPALLVLALGRPTGARAAEAEDRAAARVDIPTNAVIVPYRPDAAIDAADRMALVPYDEYLRLLRAENARGAAEADRVPPVAAAIGTARMTLSLGDGDTVTVNETLPVRVFAKEGVSLPLPMKGAVLRSATVDGQPAALGGGGDQHTVLRLATAGVYRVELALDVPVTRRGGWRQLDATLPCGPAAAVDLLVPEAKTDVAFGDGPDAQAPRRTEEANTTVRTTPGAEGRLNVRWRPEVSFGETDTSLTAESQATLDVDVDRIGLLWRTRFAFRGGERDAFEIVVPAGYDLVAVSGANVKGWQAAETAEPGGARVRIELLRPAATEETVEIECRRPTPALDRETAITLPCIDAHGAVRHTGLIALRRSPLIDLRVGQTQGLRRADIPPGGAGAADRLNSASPLGTQPFAAFEFVAAPFGGTLEAVLRRAALEARTRSIMRLAETETALETRMDLTVRGRPLFQLTADIPAGYRVEHVESPAPLEWTVDGAGRRLTVYFPQGILGETPLQVRATAEGGAREGSRNLPVWSIGEAAGQEGELVVQSDPAYDVRLAESVNLQTALPRDVLGWLSAAQRQAVRLVLRHRGADWSGRVEVARREPDVSCYAVGNVRLTDRAIEETLLLNFQIRNAGVRRLVFAVPESLAGGRIEAPLARRTRVDETGEGPWRRVELELQDDVMGEYKVLIEQDRPLGAGREFVRPPRIVTGRLEGAAIAIENAGRDEIAVVQADGMRPLDRGQKEWAAVESLIGAAGSMAYALQPGAEDPRLAFETTRREPVLTAGARIGLALCTLVVDASGAYRAEQVYLTENRTEQFLDVRLPQGAALWSASVDGDFVKPVAAAGGDERLARIPLVKTADGDLDFRVVLKYGGQLARPSPLRRTDFPFVESLNVNVELAQVELRLPGAYRWMLFDGTLRPLEEEGDFEAGILSYQNKTAKRLMKTLQYGNVFEQTRALSNLSSFQDDLSGSSKQYERVNPRNEALGKELQDMQQVLEHASREIEAQRADDGQASATDNRDRMAESFQGQRNVLARNQVLDLEPNWKSGAEPAKPDEARQGWFGFNAGWFDDAGLKEGKKSEAVDKVSSSEEAKANDGKARVRKDLSQKAVAMEQAAIFAKGEEDEWEGDVRRSKFGQRRGQKELAERYRERIEEGAQQQQAAQQMAQQAQPMDVENQQDVPTVGGGQAVVMNGMYGGRAPGGRVNAPLPMATVGGQADEYAPTGMASLDIALPPHDPARWSVFRFTTPRGEQALHARAVSRERMASLWRLGALLAAALLLWLLATAVSASAKVRGVLASALVFVGALALFLGVLPLAGLALLAVGGVLHAMRKRLAARE